MAAKVARSHHLAGVVRPRTWLLENDVAHDMARLRYRREFRVCNRGFIVYSGRVALLEGVLGLRPPWKLCCVWGVLGQLPGVHK